MNTFFFYFTAQHGRDPCADQWVIVGDRFAASTYGWVFGADLPAYGRDTINGVFQVGHIPMIRGIFQAMAADRSLDLRA